MSEDFKLNAGDTIFTLEPFDEVYVRFSPGYHEQQVVKVNGEITFAGSYVLATKNARLSDIIAKAGGVTPESYVKGASLKRQLTEDELKRMETLLALSEANKQSRDSIGVALMNVKDYSVGNDIARKYPIVIYMNGKVATTKRTAIFFKRYPKVEPGCEIVVPTKTQRERRSLAEIMSISSSATSMAAMITSIVNMIKN